MITGSSANDSASLLTAAQWIEATVQGPLVTSLAVLAIAALGFAMLNGRLPARRGITVVLERFILLGAPAIAHGIVSAAASFSDDPAPAASTIDLAAPQFEVPSKPDQSVVSDPYAGASVAR